METVTTEPLVELLPLQWANFYTHYRWSESDRLQQEELGQTYPREPVYAFMRRFETLQAPAHPVWSYEVHAAGVLVGVATLDWSTPDSPPQVRVTICSQAHRQRGYGTAALGLLLDQAFERLHAVIVEATSRPEQSAWQSLLRSFQFKAMPADNNHHWLIHRESYRAAPSTDSTSKPITVRRARAA